MQHCPNYLMHEDNYEKHAPRVSQVIAAVAKVSCKHGLWLVARVNQRMSQTLIGCLTHLKYSKGTGRIYEKNIVDGH